MDFYEKGILSTLYIVFDIDETVSSDYVVHYFDSSLWHSEIAKVAKIQLSGAGVPFPARIEEDDGKKFLIVDLSKK